MTDIFTPSLGLVKQSTGSNDQVWGDVLNDGMIDLVDDAVTGRVDVDVTAGNVSLTSSPGASDQARNMFIMIIAGTPGVTRDIVVPTLDKLYFVHNGVGDGSDVVIRTALGTGITVSDGDRSILWVDKAFGDVREVGLATGGGGSTVAPMGAATVTPSVFRNNDGTGSFAPSVFTNQQGQIGVIWIPTATGATFDVTIADTAFILDPVSGSYPAASRPALEDMTYPMEILENAVSIDCIALMPTDGSRIEFYKSDGSLWTAGSTRQINVQQKPIMYGLTGL